MGYGRIIPTSQWANLPTPDVYFTPEYHATSGLAAPDYAGSVLLEWADDEGSVYLPLLLRRIKSTKYFDATSAYGYGGPWTKGTPNLPSFSRFLNEWAYKNNVVTTFLRFHPLINNAQVFDSLWTLRFVGPTAVWDLKASHALVNGMAKNHRKNWRRADRAGLEARVTVSPDNYAEFRDLYQQSMARLDARSSYWLNDAYWVSLRDKMSKNSLLVEAMCEDRVVAAAWCLFNSDYLHFHLSGTSEEGRRLGGAYICRVAAAEWARERGLTLAHHGGGVGGADSSLLDWKAKFDPSTPYRAFYVAEVIHNHEAYRLMAEGYPDEGYFPPWRHPAGKEISAL